MAAEPLGIIVNGATASIECRLVGNTIQTPGQTTHDHQAQPRQAAGEEPTCGTTVAGVGPASNDRD